MTNKSKAIAFKYLKAPVSAIATRRNDYSLDQGGDELLVASGGGSSKSGVLNTICVLRCVSGEDAAEGIQLKEEARISTGSNLVVGLTVSSSGNYVGAITGRTCTLYRWKSSSKNYNDYKDKDSNSSSSTATNTAILVPELSFEAVPQFIDASSSTDSNDSNDESNLSAVSFSADETHIATGDRRGRIAVWKIGERSVSSSSSSSSSTSSLAVLSTPQRKLYVYCHTKQINSIQFTPFRLPNFSSVITGKPSSSSSPSSSTTVINDTLSSEDQYRLVTASNDGTTRVWSCSFLCGKSNNNNSTSTVPETIQCQVIRSQGFDQFRNKTVRGSNINKNILALWSSDSGIIDYTGKCLYTLESNYYHGSLVNKWRCLTIKKEDISTEEGRKKIFGSRICSTTEEISLSTSRIVESSSSSTATTKTTVWTLSTSRHVSKTPLSTMTINNTFNRLSLTTIGGVVFFDTDTMSLLWTDTGLASGMDTSTVTFLEKNSPIEGVVVGSITGELALVPVDAGGKASGYNRTILFFFFFLFILFLSLLLLMYVQQLQPHDILDAVEKRFHQRWVTEEL